MSDPFASSRSKLAWAKENLFPDLHRRIQEWMNDNPYAKVVEADLKPGWEVHKIKMVKPFPPEIANIVGDLVGNLREVLDNAGYALALAAGVNSPNYSAFPFAGDVTKMGNALGRSKDIPEKIHPLFCGFQPYRGGDDLLWALNELCNGKKHKFVTPMATVMLRGNAFAHGKGRPFSIPPHVWNSTENEMIVLRLGPIVVPDATWDYDFDFYPIVTVSEIPVVAGDPVLGILYELCLKVESILKAIEAESKRLGIVK